jgi:diacylglycerol kinase family enzyme
MNRWAIIYNPVAGSYRARRLDKIEAALREHGVESHFFPTQHRGHATELARTLSGFERIAVYGGDGSLNEAANGIAGRGLPLAFLPGGTANVMAHELGLPLHPVRAAVLLAQGTVRDIRPGTIDGRLFLLMAGFGFDGDAVHRVSSSLKDRLGKGAYVLAGLQALTSNPPRIEVSSNGGPPRQGVWVVAARARKYGGPFPIHPRAGLTHETLGLTVVGRMGVIPFMIANMGLGLSWRGPRIWFEERESLQIESRRPVHVQVDGDYFRAGESFTVGLAAQGIPLCFPP